MLLIPEELLEQFERGNALLFVGERITRDAEGQAMVDDLSARLTARCDIASEGNLSFPEVAQAYEDKKGRQALVQFLCDRLEELGDEPQPAHRQIAKLTDCNVLVTTCLDRRLERAFEEADRPLDVTVGNVDVAFEDERKARLYKLRGSMDRRESLVLTEGDYEDFFRDRANISVVLQGYMARKTILFVGCDLADPHLKRLYCEVTAPLGNYARRAYAFGETLSPKVCRWCKRHGIDVTETDSTILLKALSDQLAACAHRGPTVPPVLVEEPAVPLPERPYKLLDYYEAKDAAIFFGRQRETQRLTSLIHAHRLVLLYGASGVGKTSLLLAGAVPQLERADPPYETVYVRALEDPAFVIRRTIQRRLPEVSLPEDASLMDFLDATTKALGCALVIILDQFEEFFIRLSQDSRMAFITELGALYDGRDVPVKMVLSLREDWLASVDEIRQRIPEVFYVGMRLLPLVRDQAREAIVAPVERLGVSYEPALVERLLDGLVGSAGATVMPPQLQIVCSALYDGLRPGEHQINLTVYERLGGARGVLQKYLDAELGRLGSNERALARGVLEELVTSQSTKAVKDAGELAMALGVNLSEAKPVLEKLLRARLLRVLECEDGGTAYELAHEYLIREIGLRVETQARKQAEELIQQEIENWQRFRTLLAADKLVLVSEVRQELRLGTKAQELLLRSALAIRHETSPYWLERVEDEAQRAEIARDCLVNDRPAVRAWTTQVLSTWNAPVVGEMLMEVALNDAVASVRKQATVNLIKWSDPATAVTAFLNAQVVSPRRSKEALAYVLDETEAWPSLPRKTRLQVTRIVLLRRLGQAGATLFFRTLAGGVGAGIGVALAAALVAYTIWQPSSQMNGDLPRPISVAMTGLLGGAVGLVQGMGASLCLTLADTLVKKPRVYLRLLGGMVGGGAFLGVTFILLRLIGAFSPIEEVSYGRAFVGGLVIGVFASGGAALAIPAMGVWRSLFKQAVWAGIAAGGATMAIIVLKGLLASNTPDGLLVTALAYSVMEGLVGGGMALGLGILDRLPFTTRSGKG